MTDKEQHENIIRICKHEKIIKHLNKIIDMAEEAHEVLPALNKRNLVENEMAISLIAIIREAKVAKWGIE